jgi:calcineurin-like phosphoesterase family protein
MEHFWVAADHHFGHKGILRRGRPFASVEEMDEVMIGRHNARVGKHDHVIFAGDWCASDDEKYVKRLFGAMNGQKHLVPGNHFSKVVLGLPWSTPCRDQINVKQKAPSRKFVITHFAAHSWDHMYGGSYLLFGHTHGKLKPRGRSMDIGVDSWGYAPVSPDEAILAMKTYNEDFNTYIPEGDTIRRFKIHPDDQHLIVEDGLEGRNFFEQNVRQEIEQGGKALAQMYPQPDNNLFPDLSFKI